MDGRAACAGHAQIPTLFFERLVATMEELGAARLLRAVVGFTGPSQLQTSSASPRPWSTWTNLPTSLLTAALATSTVA